VFPIVGGGHHSGDDGPGGDPDYSSVGASDRLPGPRDRRTAAVRSTDMGDAHGGGIVGREPTGALDAGPETAAVPVRTGFRC